MHKTGEQALQLTSCVTLDKLISLNFSYLIYKMRVTKVSIPHQVVVKFILVHIHISMHTYIYVYMSIYLSIYLSSPQKTVWHCECTSMWIKATYPWNLLRTYNQQDLVRDWMWAMGELLVSDISNGRKGRAIYPVVWVGKEQRRWVL